jgi:6,7-dimethyl-8-ribityllumazine synthase
MPTVVEGDFLAGKLSPAIVASRFNGFIVDSLVSGAAEAFTRAGSRDEDITVYWAPGAFELPQVLRRVLDRGGHDAVVCVGAVIRGATPHFDYVAGAAAQGIARLAETASVPVTFGVITTETIEQAIERAGTKAGNKGFEAAMAAIEMVRLCRALEAR